MVTGGAPGEGGDAGFVAYEESVEGNGVLLCTALRYQHTIRGCSYNPAHLSPAFTVIKCRFIVICLPPSSPSVVSPSDASNASSRSSVPSVDPLRTGSMFHSRMDASCAPDARTSADGSCLAEDDPSSADVGSRKASARTQSSCPERVAAFMNYQGSSVRTCLRVLHFEANLILRSSPQLYIAAGVTDGQDESCQKTLELVFPVVPTPTD